MFAIGAIGDSPGAIDGGAADLVLLLGARSMSPAPAGRAAFFRFGSPPFRPSRTRSSLAVFPPRGPSRPRALLRFLNAPSG